MAKSARSKTKLANRRKKRTESYYAVLDAARTKRISDKLLGKDQESAPVDHEGAEADGDAAPENDEAMQSDSEKAPAPKISTSGPRRSRHEEWRLSKGMSLKPKSKGQNKHGVQRGKNNGKTKRRR